MFHHNDANSLDIFTILYFLPLISFPRNWYLPLICVWRGILVRQAIQDLKVRKAAGPSGVTAEMIKAAGEQAVDWLTSICNRIVKEEAIPESWQMSELVPIYKGKGDVLECSSSRGIKLLEHGMKVAERVLERRLRQAVEIDKMQFGFRPGTGTTHAIFIARQLQKRYRGKHRELFWAFVDLEKALTECQGK